MCVGIGSDLFKEWGQAYPRLSHQEDYLAPVVKNTILHRLATKESHGTQNCCDFCVIVVKTEAYTFLCIAINGIKNISYEFIVLFNTVKNTSEFFHKSNNLSCHILMLYQNLKIGTK